MFSCFLDSFNKESTDNHTQLWNYMLDHIPNMTTKWHTLKSPNNPTINFFYQISISKITEYIILGLTFLNLIVLALDFEGAPKIYDDIGSIINNTTTSIFILEALVKIIGLGHIGYFDNGWNRFDFFVVVSAIIDICFTLGNANSTDKTTVKFLKTFQILRILRMIRVTR